MAVALPRTPVSPCARPEACAASGLASPPAFSCIHVSLGARGLRGHRGRAVRQETDSTAMTYRPDAALHHGRPLRRSAGGKAERVALGVLADRPPRAGVDDRPPERADLIERGREIRDREVGQRERVAGPATARVEPDRGTAGPGLPAIPLVV